MRPQGCRGLSPVFDSNMLTSFLTQSVHLVKLCMPPRCGSSLHSPKLEQIHPSRLMRLHAIQSTTCIYPARLWIKLTSLDTAAKQLTIQLSPLFSEPARATDARKTARAAGRSVTLSAMAAATTDASSLFVESAEHISVQGRELHLHYISSTRTTDYL